MEYHSLDELAVLQQNDFIRAAIDRVGAGVVIADPEQEDMPLIYVNKGFEELTGYEAQEVLGKNCRFLQGEHTEQKGVDQIREAIHTKETVKVELLNYRKDGSEFWNELQIYTVYIDKLNQDFFVGVQQDVTKRKEAERLVGHYSSEVKRLSTPIVPVKDNVSVLPLIGNVDEERLQQMLDAVSFHVQEQKEDYLILDLSAVQVFNEDIHISIYQLNQLLDLMGTTLILSGVTPKFAMGSSPYANFSELSLRSYVSVKQALQMIGEDSRA
ncbi:STAS domain-containing protein [Salimicrobium halophilum]|uniref:PAS domain S-box-containing protein n=1 Tax=Salimicrobium halophilum TaxID=86666 RepID=A0A1G8WPH2_9BACI|nr:STAS domain-containing protein [Salimicrobium halophilum]SDJ80302.1 PAS domain S-box-containing protein [Salimicrobium halophilum]